MHCFLKKNYCESKQYANVRVLVGEKSSSIMEKGTNQYLENTSSNVDGTDCPQTANSAVTGST
jgi:hypothetical protein